VLVQLSSCVKDNGWSTEGNACGVQQLIVTAALQQL
jgi:hypothetical protein